MGNVLGKEKLQEARVTGKGRCRKKNTLQEESGEADRRHLLEHLQKTVFSTAGQPIEDCF